jgi:hypothetical protein
LYNQELNTSSRVTFLSVTATQYLTTFAVNARQRVSIGGVSDTYLSTIGFPALLIMNRYSFSDVPIIAIQAFKSNFAASSIYPPSEYSFPIIKTDLADGTFDNPTAVKTGHHLFSLSVGGHDGITWVSNRGVGNPARMIFTAQEDWNGTYDGPTTNAGTRISLSAQPPGVYLSTSSQQTVFHQYWSEFGQGQLPINNIGFGGGADDVFHICTTSDTQYNGHGSTNVYLTNSTFNLWGVPREDSNPDNYTLPDTLSISFRANRRNGMVARRNRIQAGDTLGRIKFFGETGISSTSTQSQIKTAELFVQSLNTFTSTSIGGAVVVLTTLNSGTNVESQRLSLSNVEHIYSSNIHSFKTANSATIATITANSFVASNRLDLKNLENIYSSNIHSFKTANSATIATINTNSFFVKSVRSISTSTIPAGFSPMYYNTSTGEIIVVY